MRYQKPEIVPLGSAEELILGVKIGTSELHIFIPRPVLDSELDD
jgi:hypothetical protein